MAQCGMKPSSSVSLPPSATHAGVAWAGVLCMPDLLWQKVQRRVLAATPGPGSWPRVAVKCVGLAGSIGFIALLYWLFPEYYQGQPFYGNYYAALEVLLPPWAVLAAPYLYWVGGKWARSQRRCCSAAGTHWTRG